MWLWNVLHERRTARQRLESVQSELGAVLGQRLLLVPGPGSGGGGDTICLARSCQDPAQVVACVRICCPGPLPERDEPDLPRVVLPIFSRMQREAQAYAALAPQGIAPRVLAQGRLADGTAFLANAWLPWPRAADVLRQSETQVWQLLPLVLDSIRRMHQCGIWHLDLNCGNILVHPDQQASALIDFEYGAAPGVSQEALEVFDYLRLAHNVLKPRRGLHCIQREPERFVECFARGIGDRQPGDLSLLAPACFQRIVGCAGVREGLERLFGTFPV